METFKETIVQGDAIGARAYHRSVVCRGWLYIVMGYNGVSRLNDIVGTQNGFLWTKRTGIRIGQGNNIAPRDSFGLCAHNEKVYLFGGWNGSTYYNDVYESPDMVNWRRLPDAAWCARYGFCTFSFDGRLWVMGGKNSSTNLNDVWYTRNMVNWTHEPNASWAIRRFHAGLVHDNRIFIVGGLGASRYNDIYCTSDGRRWVRCDDAAEFPARDSHSLTAFGGNRLLLIGGQDGAASYSNDMWTSSTGNNWVRGINNIPMGTRRGHTVDFFNSRLILVGGINGASTYKGDVWETNMEMFGV